VFTLSRGRSDKSCPVSSGFGRVASGQSSPGQSCRVVSS